MGDNSKNKKVKFDSGSQDELILQQHREIEKEISDKIQLVGDKEPLSSLTNEYSNDEVYHKKANTLNDKYGSIRRTRPDGNCFFRAFGYAYFEQLLSDPEKFRRFEEYAKSSKERLISLGFSPFTLEEFHDVFMEIVNLAGKGDEGADELYNAFNDQWQSDYVVVYLRLLTSAHLQQQSEFYQNFIEGNKTMADFCRQEVEPMFRESDHIHIIALSSEVNVGVRVMYMDRGGSTEVIAHDFPEGCEPAVHLLYRPGHYDILYPIPS